MDGRQAIKIIGGQRIDQVVITTMSTAREWPIVSKRKELDLPLIGCMGKASSLGLGVALGAPERQVLVLDGEGSLLMNLGTLVTIAAQAPNNLVHFVFDNSAYDTSGGQPTPGAGTVDFAGLALEAGYRAAYEFDEAEQFRRELPSILQEEGPVLVVLKVPKGWAEAPFPRRKTADAMKDVGAALAGS
jgi:thiamine pyrophosphate-dependent acetolactate synthase large subunit-like protein